MFSPQEIKQQVEQIVSLSRRMLASGEQQQWLEVAELEAQRQTSLQTLFATPLPEASLQAIRGELEEVLSLDNQLVALGQQARDSFAQDMRTITKGRSAVNTYNRFTT